MESHSDYGKRRAAETGHPWYVSRTWQGTSTVAEHAPEGRAWHAFTPDGRRFSSAYGRTSIKGKAVLREITAHMRSLRTPAPSTPTVVREGEHRGLGRPTIPPPTTSEPFTPARYEALGATPEQAARWAAPTSEPFYAIGVPVLPPPPAEPPVLTMPAPMTDYLARLLAPAKRTYARALALHLLHGTPAPTVPDRDWTDDVARKVARYLDQKVSA